MGSELSEPDFAGVRVAIGGAGHGIGAACARLLAARGAKLFLCARDGLSVESLASRLRDAGASAWSHAADLGTDPGAESFAREAFAKLGGVDIGLICAGVSQKPKLLVESDRAFLLAQLQGNTIAPALAAMALARAWHEETISSLEPKRDRLAPGRHRQLLLLGSLLTVRPPQEGVGAYTAAKNALDSLVRTLAEELWPEAQVNAFCLGPVATRMHEEAGTPRKRIESFDTPDEIAPLVLQLLGPRLRGLSGRCIDAEAFACDPELALWSDGRLALVAPLRPPPAKIASPRGYQLDSTRGPVDISASRENDSTVDSSISTNHARPQDENSPARLENALPEAEPGRAPSPRVRRALRETATALQRYPTNADQLARRIAQLHGVDPACVLLSGGGATTLLERALVAIGRAGDELVSPFPTFELLSTLASRAGLRHRPVFARRDPDGLFWQHLALPLLDSIGPRTRAVYVATPDNPTGVSLPIPEERALVSGLGRNCALILDEAWSLEVPAENSNAIAHETLSASCPIVRLRSLSKLYGLAGLRVGYALASPELASLLRRLEPPFPLGAPQIAAALAALDDLPRARKSALLLVRKRARLVQAIRAMGLLASEGDSPLILIRDPRPGRNAGPLLFALRAANIAVQEAHWDVSALSISVGTPAQNRRALSALSRAR